MRMALGIALIWTGAACLWLSRADLQAATPWSMYRSFLTRLAEG